MKWVFVFVAVFVSNIALGQKYIADYTVAKEEILRSIPREVIDKARNEFKILYIHTSHGTHVTYGLNGLQYYKQGDGELYAVKVVNILQTKVVTAPDSLELYDWYGSDLSQYETTFDEKTRAALDDPKYADINVVMWSWCSINYHEPAKYYLPKMKALIEEYGEGGSKIGTGEGQRAKPVKFIFMTGHADSNHNIGEGLPKNQADIIDDFCNANGYLCLDYFSIESHDMNGNYWDDAGDDSYSVKYRRSEDAVSYYFFQDYQDAHALGKDYFYNRDINDDINTGKHVNQHITANRKAYAMWWILARLTGWEDTPTTIKDDLKSKNRTNFIFNQNTNEIKLNDFTSGTFTCKVYSLAGNICFEKRTDSHVINLSDLRKGMYIVSLQRGNEVINKKIIINR